MSITIDSSKCKQCLKCTEMCPTNHLILQNGSPVSNNDSKCITCLHCVSSCRQGAVTCGEIPVTVIPADKASPSINRRSHRIYKDKEIDKTLIDAIINKANTAPIMGAREERYFLVINDKKVISQLRVEI